MPESQADLRFAVSWFHDPRSEMLDHITEVTAVIHTLRDQDHTRHWFDTMRVLVDQKNLHGLLAGHTCRLLLDESIFKIEEAAVRLEQALGRSASVHLSVEEAVQSAAWLDGFLQGSELLILHDRQRWQLLDTWVSMLDEQRFVDIVPLLRRTFSSFSQASRQLLYDRIRHGTRTSLQEPLTAIEFDHDQANGVLPLIGQLLGIEKEPVKSE